ncbi:MAG: hypothetical protein ACJARY_001497 [Candidatus Azotimanducaceae bacterium]|jgi:hypothetical protein
MRYFTLAAAIAASVNLDLAQPVYAVIHTYKPLTIILKITRNL